MKWNTYPKLNVVGEIKHVRRFLFFPTNINNETRWLELTWITKVYQCNIAGSGWENYCWGKYKEEGQNIYN